MNYRQTLLYKNTECPDTGTHLRKWFPKIYVNMYRVSITSIPVQQLKSKYSTTSFSAESFYFSFITFSIYFTGYHDIRLIRSHRHDAPSDHLFRYQQQAYVPAYVALVNFPRFYPPVAYTSQTVPVLPLVPNLR